MRLLLVTISILFSLLIMEMGVRFIAFDSKSREMGAKQLWASYNNAYVQGLLPGDSKCAFPDTLVPHPYLVYVHRRTGECFHAGSNNRGLLSKDDIPFEKDDRYYSILLLGGSAANHLGLGKRIEGGRDIWLEDYLNSHYQSPNGKPFRIINGAAGGWRQPNQTTMLALFGDVMDAAITVDGYNEAMNTFWRGPIDFPDAMNFLYVARPRGISSSFTVIEFLQWYRRVAMGLPPLRNSYLSYFIFQRVMNRAALDNSLQAGRKQLFDRLFLFPDSWKNDKRRAWNKAKYKTYVKLQTAEAKALGINYAHFLQPIRWIGKKLTDEEKSHQDFISVDDYKEIFVSAVDELRREGLPISSLTHAFEGIEETIYADFIHCKFDENKDSRGYSILSKKIGKQIAERWNLKPIWEGPLPAKPDPGMIYGPPPPPRDIPPTIKPPR